MSPSGLSRIRAIADENSARMAQQSTGSGMRFFGIDNGQTVHVRFLEQGENVSFFWTHQLPKKPGQTFGDSVMCLDQDDQGLPCPACARGKNRSPRVAINLIWFDAPRFEREQRPGEDFPRIKRDANNKPIINGVEDCVATWNCSQQVGGRLDTLHNDALQHGGLMMGVYRVVRRGTGKNTAYDIDLVEYRQPTPQEVELFNSKPDPRGIMRELSYGDMERAYSAATGGPVQQAPSGFAAAAVDVSQRGGFGGAPAQPQVAVTPAPAPAPGVNLGALGQ
jgi:hypothetical protein